MNSGAKVGKNLQTKKTLIKVKRKFFAVWGSFANFTQNTHYSKYSKAALQNGGRVVGAFHFKILFYKILNIYIYI